MTEESFKSLRWNVLVIADDGCLRNYNIFCNKSFRMLLAYSLSKDLSKLKFDEQLRSNLFNQFRGRTQYEFTAFTNSGSKAYIDVYAQMMTNYDIFSNYVWNELQKM